MQKLSDIDQKEAKPSSCSLNNSFESPNKLNLSGSLSDKDISVTNLFDEKNQDCTSALSGQDTLDLRLGGMLTETQDYEEHSEFKLHAIDLQSTDTSSIVNQLMQQMRTVGFCLISNVPGHDEQRLLEAKKAFHALPVEVKRKITVAHFHPGNKNIYHGYFPFLDNDPSHKEFYDMGRPYEDYTEWERNGSKIYEPSPWLNDPEIKEDCCKLLSSDDLSEYQWIFDTLRHQFKIMHDLSLQLISCLAVGLGKQSNYFDDWFKDECISAMRTIHYNTRDPTKTYKSKLVTPEHTDSGFITLLSTFGFPGLQVEIDGVYRSIKPCKDAIIVNIGDTLQKISNSRIKATRHRVLDIGCERYSAPFFLIPKLSARISPIHLQSGRKTCEDRVYEEAEENQAEISQLRCYGDLIFEKMTNAFGEWHNFHCPPLKFDYTQKWNK